MPQIIILICLMMAAEIQAQCERPSVGENRVLTAESDKPNFQEGSTATFKCATGYNPVEGTYSKSITCTGKQWTDLQLQCKKKSCGTLPDLSNGKYMYDEGIFFGATVTAICNTGFKLVGDKFRYCKAEGWDGRAPICDVAKCSAPPKIDNGNLEAERDEYEYGEAVAYSCMRGYVPRGSLIVTCSSDGTFQPSPPQCLSGNCTDPNVKNAIRIEGKAPPYVHGNYVQYKCNSGYIMEGEDYLTCKENGWDSSPPKCIPQCDRPSFGKHRVLTAESDKPYFPEGSTATFKCSPGYKPVDETVSKSVTCKEKQWTHLQLECEKKSCERLEEFPNGKYFYEGMEFGSTVRAECNIGHKLVEEYTRTCQDKGWDGTDPVCEVVKCSVSPQINHGHLDEPTKDEYKYGEVVTYSCIDGYIPNENRNILCSADGTFQPSPSCSRIDSTALSLGLGLGLGLFILFIASIGIYYVYKHCFGKNHPLKVSTRNKDVEKDDKMCASAQIIW